MLQQSEKVQSRMTFVEVLEETTVHVCFENLKSRFKNTAKSAITLQYISFCLLKEILSQHRIRH